MIVALPTQAKRGTGAVIFVGCAARFTTSIGKLMAQAIIHKAKSLPPIKTRSGQKILNC